MLSNEKGKKLNTYISDYVIFDLETTGISCASDRVVEISAVKVRNGQADSEFSTLVNPEIPIPFRASAVNGITDDMVEDAPIFEIALKEFLDFIGDDVLVGHNIHTFDMKFIYRDVERYFGKTINNDYIDTLQIARAYLPQLRHHKLVDLAEYYGISSVGAHRALNDCRMNQQIFEKLAEEITNPSAAANSIPKCQKCGNIMKKRSGKFGEFWGCMSYPDCKYTRNA